MKIKQLEWVFYGDRFYAKALPKQYYSCYCPAPNEGRVILYNDATLVLKSDKKTLIYMKSKSTMLLNVDYLNSQNECFEFAQHHFEKIIREYIDEN